MKTIVVGFDSAWTCGKRGALAAVAVDGSAPPQVIQEPTSVTFDEAAHLIESWSTPTDQLLVMLDQPTIVFNDEGCRSVERVVSSLVSRARGGVQPANTGRLEMFGPDAPVWPFLKRMGHALDPSVRAPRRVIETYPALALLGLGWVREDGTLLKYNPERRKNYRARDWERLCELLAEAFENMGVAALGSCCVGARFSAGKPTKAQQDALDALLCLLVGLLWLKGKTTIQVGSVSSGLMVVPDHCGLWERLLPRIDKLGWDETAWLTRLNWPALPPGWDEARVEKVVRHYEAQSEDEAVAEDEAALPEDVSQLRGWRPARQVVEKQGLRQDATLEETFGTVPDLAVPGRDEWDRESR